MIIPERICELQALQGRKHEFEQIEILVVDFKVAALDFREVENVGDEFEERANGLIGRAAHTSPSARSVFCNWVLLRLNNYWKVTRKLDIILSACSWAA